MKREITLDEWMKIRPGLEQYDYYQTCTPFASFSMAGETHIWYKTKTEPRIDYETVGGNGYMVIYEYSE